MRAVRIIDGVAEEPIADRDVVIADGRIGEILPHDPSRLVPDGTEVMDGAGRTLLPGLIDVHAHYTFGATEGSLQAIARRTDAPILSAAAEQAGRALRGGVTTARGAGSIRNLECLLRDEIVAVGVLADLVLVGGDRWSTSRDRQTDRRSGRKAGRSAPEASGAARQRLSMSETAGSGPCQRTISSVAKRP